MGTVYSKGMVSCKVSQVLGIDATAQYMGCLAHQQSVRKLYWKSKELLAWHTSEA